MDRFLPILYIVGWFGLVFGASYLINWLLIRSIIRRYYRFFVAPGVIVHELSHALGCLLTGSQIIEINFWKASGGHVRHLQPAEPIQRIIADPIIALAPIWGTLILLGILTRVMLPNLFNLIYTADFSMIQSIIDWTDWHSWLYLYLVTSLVATMAPSSTDMRYGLASLVALALGLVALLFVPGFSNWLAGLGQTLRPFALFTLAVLAVGIIFAFLLALPNRNQHFVPRSQLE